MNPDNTVDFEELKMSQELGDELVAEFVQPLLDLLVQVRRELRLAGDLFWTNKDGTSRNWYVSAAFLQIVIAEEGEGRTISKQSSRSVGTQPTAWDTDTQCSISSSDVQSDPNPRASSG